MRVEQKTIEDYTEELEDIEARRQAILTKKLDIDQELGKHRVYVDGCKSIAASTGKYENPEAFNAARRKMKLLGVESQKYQATLAILKAEEKRVKARLKILDDKKFNETRRDKKQYSLHFEAYFVDCARAYLSGAEFEIIAGQAKSKMAMKGII